MKRACADESNDLTTRKERRQTARAIWPYARHSKPEELARYEDGHKTVEDVADAAKAAKDESLTTIIFRWRRRHILQNHHQRTAEEIDGIMSHTGSGFEDRISDSDLNNDVIHHDI